MKARIEIDMNSEAFAERPSWELSRILHGLANRIVHREDWSTLRTLPLCDEDGKEVGALELQRESAQEAEAVVIDSTKPGVLGCFFNRWTIELATELDADAAFELVGTNIKFRFEGLTAEGKPRDPVFICKGG